MNKAMALLAFITLAVFVGILLWKVPQIDLILVGVLTIGLVAYDFFTSARDKRD